MLLGAHLSIAGGMHKALERAARLRFGTLAIFLRNQRQWSAPPLTDQAVETFRRTRRRLGIGPVAGHGSYLLNLAGRDPVRRRSLQAAGDELQRCRRLGLEYYVFHPGSFTGQSLSAGMAALTDALDALADALDAPAGPPGAPPVTIVLETTAGAGGQLGGSFEQLADVLARVARPERFGVCLDTCHVFAAGYDLRTPGAYAETMDRFDRTVGLERLKVAHLNDSRFPLGSRRDRHEHIGKGCIGLAGFANLVNDPRLAAVPMILETPKGRTKSGRDFDALNAARIRRLLRRR